jgi:hypothetical protein
MTALICPECAYENEVERIYCHSCGARLDRSAAASRVPPQKQLEETQRHLRKMLKPRGRFRPLFFLLCKLILGACLVAVVAQLILPPEAPPAVKDVAPPQINFDMESAIISHPRGPLQYTEEQVNAYLAFALKGKQSALNKPLLTFKRAVVAFSEGAVTVTVERSVFGYSLYSRSSYAVQVEAGKTLVSNKGGNIGRLALPPIIMQSVDIIFADLWSALGRERKLLAQMGAIEFREKRVLLSPRPR